MNSYRRTAIVVGVLFLATHVTAIGARILYGPYLTDATQLATGDDSAVLVGALLEVLLALTVVGTAIALHPVAARQNASLAVGYIALRTLEASVILTGVVGMLTLVSVRASVANIADDTSVAPLIDTLVAFQDFTFLVGPGFICGTNTVLIAWIMLKSGLVPRFIAVLGLVGGPLVFAFNVVKMFGFSEQLMPWAALAVVPIFAWELLLAGYLIVKGFRPAALAQLGHVDGAAQRLPVSA
ncbi:DUF4386 domain-containing protein [Conyzicola sp.]|uniref:DUF4386 domain-containing protein n=1 Tax=Conyzicola sp. TaxID=1969404 RepID=UPI00398A4DB7